VARRQGRERVQLATGYYADFFGTIVRPLPYLFQTAFLRDRIDHRHRDRNGKLVSKDGNAA